MTQKILVTQKLRTGWLHTHTPPPHVEFPGHCARHTHTPTHPRTHLNVFSPPFEAGCQMRTEPGTCKKTSRGHANIGRAHAKYTQIGLESSPTCAYFRVGSLDFLWVILAKCQFLIAIGGMRLAILRHFTEESVRFIAVSNCHLSHFLKERVFG